MSLWWIWWLASAMAGDALSFSAVRVVEHGKASPSVTFTPAVSGELEVKLTCGTRSFDRRERLRPGVPITLELSGLPPGTWDCAGSVYLTDDGGGTGSMPLSLQVASLEPMQWACTLDDVDLDQRTLSVGVSRPLADATLEVWSADGGRVDSVRADLSDPSRARFRWSTDAEVVKLVVHGVDTHGTTGDLELSPWFYSIPHEDVVFGSGRHDIPAVERSKLEATWQDVTRVLKKYGPVVEIQLYVAGYTDTVGDPARNQALSERRARAIAGWFRQRGFSGTIWYQGFGEEVLAVPTPDETDEQRNRRAVYILAAEVPESPEVPRANWHRL